MIQGSDRRTRPVLIFGSPRSGTSLLSRLLDSHPNIAIPFESHLFNQWRPRRRSYGDLADPARRLLLIEDIVTYGVVRDWTPQPRVEEVAALVGRPGFAGVATAFMEWWAREMGKPRWGEKTPHHTLLWRDVLKAWAEAQAIIVERDPRDVALSWKEARFGGDHVLPLARRWRRYQGACADIRKALPKTRRIDLRYEDLVADPEAELKGIMAFLGEDYDPAQLRFHESGEAWRTDARNEARLQSPITTRSLGRWRSRLSRSEVRLIEYAAGDMMRRRGYEPVTSASPSRRALGFARWVDGPVKRALGLLKNGRGFVYLGRDLSWRLRLAFRR